MQLIFTFTSVSNYITIIIHSNFPKFELAILLITSAYVSYLLLYFLWY